MIEHKKVDTAIILCAGRGRRLSPYTDDTPKPLLAIDNRPTLDYILASLKHAGIERVVLVTHYLAEQVAAYAMHQTYFSVDSVQCVRQEQLAGTADATEVALKVQPSWFKDSFLLTASDYIVPLPFYKSLVDAHQQNQKAITISIKRVAESELAMRSSVRFDSEGHVQEIVEKPTAGTASSPLSANLIFVLPADIVAAIHQVETSPRGEREVQSAINSYLQENGAGSSLEQLAPQEWHPDMR